MATSSSVHTNTYGGRTITLLVEELSTSIENNTSTIKWTLTSGTSSTYHSVYEITAWVGGTADSNKVYGPKTADWSSRAFPCKDGSTSGTLTITHNADGTANPLSFRLRGSVYTNNPQNYDGSITLTTIPRASSFTISKTSGGAAATSWNLGEALYVNITRASSSFTHKVYFVVGNSGNQTISNSAGTSANTTLASSLAQYIPSSSATATIYVDTYSGSTKIGSASKTFTINVPSNVLPSISSVTKTDTTGYLSTYGAYVQGKSNLRVQTSASGNYSSITNYTIRLKNSGGTILNTKTGNDVTFSNISYVGTITIEVIVTDSRNRTATNTSTISVATYENPKITLFTAERLNNDSTITVKINASITNVNNYNSNAKHFYMWVREKGTSSWGSAVINSSSSYTYNNTSSPYTISKDENKSWQFMLEVDDSFAYTTQVIEVGTTFELMNWKADGTALAIGKVSEKSNTFEVALDTEIDGTLDVTGNTTISGNLTANNFIPIETGTWEPKYQNCSYTHYQWYQAHYVKIGKMVILIFHDRPNITPTGGAQAQIGGLPFTPAWPQLGSGSLGTCMVTNTNYIPSVTISNAGYIELANDNVANPGATLIQWKSTSSNNYWIDGFVIYWSA